MESADALSYRSQGEIKLDLEWSLNLVISVLIRRGEDTERQREEGYVKTETGDCDCINTN